MKKIHQLIGLCLIITLTYPAAVIAQYESSSFNLTGMGVAMPFSRDYQSLFVNPANLDLETGYEQKKAIGFFDFTSSIQTELLTKSQLLDGLMGKSENSRLTYAEQLENVEKLALKPTAIDIDLLSIGISFQTEKAGAFAFALRDKIDFYSQIDRDLTELLWLGNQSPYFDSLVVMATNNADSIIARPENFDPQQFSIISAFIDPSQAQSAKQLIGNTKLGFTWFREFSAGYGKRLIRTSDFEFHIGIGAKYLLGQGTIEIDGEKGEVYSSLSPLFTIDYTMLENAPLNPSALPTDAPGLKPVGKGFGIDFGGTCIVKKQWIINAAVNDIGQITWDGNVYELGDGKVTDIDDSGIESFDIFQVINSFNGLDAILKWKGLESRTTRLNTTARLGVGFEKFQKLRIGFDLIAPMNENQANLQRAAINAGIEFSPWPWIHLQTGFSDGGNYAPRMPAGIYFTTKEGSHEFGVASRDILTFFQDDNPTASIAMGFLRFRY